MFISGTVRAALHVMITGIGCKTSFLSRGQNCIRLNLDNFIWALIPACGCTSRRTHWRWCSWVTYPAPQRNPFDNLAHLHLPSNSSAIYRLFPYSNVKQTRLMATKSTFYLGGDIPREQRALSLLASFLNNLCLPVLLLFIKELYVNPYLPHASKGHYWHVNVSKTISTLIVHVV